MRDALALRTIQDNQPTVRLKTGNNLLRAPILHDLWGDYKEVTVNMSLRDCEVPTVVNIPLEPDRMIGPLPLDQFGQLRGLSTIHCNAHRSIRSGLQTRWAAPIIVSQE